MKFKVYYTRKIDLEAIEKELKENFGVAIEDAGFLSLPKNAFNRMRQQYNAILLLPCIPPYSIWIVDKDIYVHKMNFVFGIAWQRKAIVSTYRLPDEIIPKEVVHEVGHLFGLEHSRNHCVMQFSNSLMEAIAKPSKLCVDCRRKLNLQYF